MSRWLYCFVLLCWLGSCKNGEEVLPDRGYDFFPLQVGNYQIYDVDSSYYSQNIKYPVAYQLKQTVTDSISNGQGGLTYIISRAKRSTSGQPWQVVDTWSARREDVRAVVNEGNIPFLKLIFPLANGLTWNGNTYNTLGGDQYCGAGNSSCDIYSTENIHKSFTLTSGSSFDDTITVIQSDNTDPIVKRDVRTEVYGKGVGLISKEVTILNYCTTQCQGKSQFINTGVVYRQNIIAYGHQ